MKNRSKIKSHHQIEGPKYKINPLSLCNHGGEVEIELNLMFFLKNLRLDARIDVLELRIKQIVVEIELSITSSAAMADGLVVRYRHLHELCTDDCLKSLIRRVLTGWSLTSLLG